MTAPVLNNQERTTLLLALGMLANWQMKHVGSASAVATMALAARIEELADTPASSAASAQSDGPPNLLDHLAAEDLPEVLKAVSFAVGFTSDGRDQDRWAALLNHLAGYVADVQDWQEKQA